MDLLLATTSDVLRLETAILLIVVVALAVLAKAVVDLKSEVKSLRRGDASGSPQAEPSAMPVVSPASMPTPADEAVTPEIFAVIVAAVHASLGDQHQIVSVTPAETLWSREGRRTIFGSHSIR